jgi:hypothetical protein
MGYSDVFSKNWQRIQFKNVKVHIPWNFHLDRSMSIISHLPISQILTLKKSLDAWERNMDYALSTFCTETFACEISMRYFSKLTDLPFFWKNMWHQLNPISSDHSVQLEYDGQTRASNFSQFLGFWHNRKVLLYRSKDVNMAKQRHREPKVFETK